MRIKQGYKTRRICGQAVVVPASSADFNGMITLNETAEFFWSLLEDGTEKSAALDAICAEYDVDRVTAEADFDEFLTLLERKGLLE